MAAERVSAPGWGDEARRAWESLDVEDARASLGLSDDAWPSDIWRALAGLPDCAHVTAGFTRCSGLCDICGRFGPVVVAAGAHLRFIEG